MSAATISATPAPADPTLRAVTAAGAGGRHGRGGPGPDLDALLGPAASRFFGSGYRRVRQSLHRVEVVSGADGTTAASAVATLEQPTVWSAKAAGAVRPHLSTLDGLVLAVRLAEVLLAEGAGLDEAARAGAWVRRVTIRAGAQPQEDGLRQVRVSARLTPPAAGTGDEPVVSRVDCRIGTMAVRCEIVHAAVGPGAAAGSFVRHPRGGPSPYGDGYRGVDHHVTGVVTDADVSTARAVVTRTPVPAEVDGDHVLGAAHVGTPSMVDAFVVALQLGQVLLYELDGVDRADSETLWMRSTTLTAPDPAACPRPGGRAVPVAFSLHDPAVLSTTGGAWRTATVAGEFGGTAVRCQVTHRLARP